MHIHEVGRKAASGIGGSHPPEQAHGSFGQIVEDDVIDASTDQLRHRQRAVDEEGAAAADPDHLT